MKLSKSFIGLIIVSLVFYLYATNSFSIFQRDSALEIVDFSIENSTVNVDIPSNPYRNPYYGDLHVHTKYSFDAYIFGTLATPDDAYEFAKGKPIKHPGGFDVSIDRPLDFYGVTDHGTFLGHVEEAATPGTQYYEAPSSAPVNDINSPENLNISTIPRLSLIHI